MTDFCLDPEGWGPVSALRYSFTPCFEDGILAAIPPLFLIIWGSAQSYTFSQHSKVPDSRNWTYVTKLVVVTGLLALNCVLTGVRWQGSLEWQHDVFFWSALLKVFATGFAFSLHHLEYVRNPSCVPSGVLLFYWLMTILVDGIKVYSMVDAGKLGDKLFYFILFCVVLGGEVLIFSLE